MKRASYRYGIKWIAYNDSIDDFDIESISGFISVLLLADLFDVSPRKVAADIIKIRRRP